jgi:hypothetical protein
MKRCEGPIKKCSNQEERAKPLLCVDRILKDNVEGMDARENNISGLR